MRYHKLKVEPYSEAERTLMHILKDVKLPQGSVRCYLSEDTMNLYNEYRITHEAFLIIKDYLKKVSA